MQSNIFTKRNGDEKTMEEKIQFIYEKMQKDQKDMNNMGFDKSKEPQKDENKQP